MSLALSTGIQEALVAILLFDPVGSKVAAGLVPHGAYDAHYRDLAREAIEYLEKYGKPAGDHALDLVESLKTRRADSAGIYQRIYDSLLLTKDGINREYVFAQAGKFAQGQRIRDGLSKAMDAAPPTDLHLKDGDVFANLMVETFGDGTNEDDIREAVQAALDSLEEA